MDLSIIKKALAATCFINAAKEKLKIAIYVAGVEEVILDNAGKTAEVLNLDADSLKNFVSLYCQVSKKIQEFLRSCTKEDYRFSDAESEVLACLKQEVPELATAESLINVQTILENSDYDTAKKVLAWARNLIVDSNQLLYLEIKNSKENGSLSDTEQLYEQMQTLIDSLFLDQHLKANLTELLELWAEALHQCNQVKVVQNSL